MNSCELSFIIPAYNEEENISNTLAKIKQYTPSKYRYEVIVVDHGSSDSTAQLAEQHGANAIIKRGGTISGLRNSGVEASSGEVLIFIDADISLTAQWQNNIPPVIERLRNNAKVLTGSWYCIPEEPNWIEKYWFEPLQKLNNTHINSGHMIISRKCFNELSGFDEKLETGEDYDISMRAKANGLEVIDDHALKVIHEGYPKSLREFILREYWHGKGDASSISAMMTSKVALASLIIMLFNLGLLFSAAWFNIPAMAIFMGGIVAVCLISSYQKFNKEPAGVIAVNMVLYYFYFIARGASIIMKPFRRGLKKRQR